MTLDRSIVRVTSSVGAQITLKEGFLYHIRTCDTVYKGLYFWFVDYVLQELVFYNAYEEERIPVRVPLAFIHHIWTGDHDYSRYPSECQYCRVD